MTRIVGHFVLSTNHRKQTAMVMALHATKGWQRFHEASISNFRELGWKGNYRRDPQEGPLPMQRLMEHRIRPIEITEKMLLRHKWYRIEKAAAAFRASLPNENRLDVE